MDNKSIGYFIEGAECITFSQKFGLHGADMYCSSLGGRDKCYTNFSKWAKKDRAIKKL